MKTHQVSILDKVSRQLLADLVPYLHGDFQRVEVTFIVDGYKRTQRTKRHDGRIRRVVEVLQPNQAKQD